MLLVVVLLLLCMRLLDYGVVDRTNALLIMQSAMHPFPGRNYIVITCRRRRKRSVSHSYSTVWNFEADSPEFVALFPCLFCSFWRKRAQGQVA